MPREVINPMMARAMTADAERFKQAIEDNARRQDEKKALIAAALAQAVRDLPDDQLRTIRMHVALRLPQKPMSPEEAQAWLDEHVIGVAKYMMTGRIV